MSSIDPRSARHAGPETHRGARGRVAPVARRLRRRAFQRAPGRRVARRGTPGPAPAGTAADRDGRRDASPRRPVDDPGGSQRRGCRHAGRLERREGPQVRGADRGGAGPHRRPRPRGAAAPTGVGQRRGHPQCPGHRADEGPRGRPRHEHLGRLAAARDRPLDRVPHLRRGRPAAAGRLVVRPHLARRRRGGRRGPVAQRGGAGRRPAHRRPGWRGGRVGCGPGDGRLRRRGRGWGDRVPATCSGQAAHRRIIRFRRREAAQRGTARPHDGDARAQHRPRSPGRSAQGAAHLTHRASVRHRPAL